MAPEKIPTPSPEEQPAQKGQVTPERIKETWDKFNNVEKGLITQKNEEDFKSALGALKPEAAKKWKLFRVLIKNNSPLVSLIIKELEEKKTMPAPAKVPEVKKEKSLGDKLFDMGFEKNESGQFFYIILRGYYPYSEGLQNAKDKFKEIKTKYPSREQAIEILKKFKEKFPDDALAAFIDQKKTYAYLTKTGKEGQFTGERPPVDTKLFVIIVADKQ